MKKALFTIAVSTLLMTSGCGSSIDYTLPDEPIPFVTGSFVDTADDNAGYMTITYQGRTYIPYGTQKSSITADDLGSCLGYIVQDGKTIDDSRIYLLADDPDADYLVYMSTEGIMNPTIFFRAMDTKGQNISVPDFIEPPDDGYWK